MKEISEILSALSDEISAVRKKYRQHPIVVQHLKVTNVKGELFYEGIIGSMEEGDILSIPEGVPVRVIYREYNHIARQYDECVRNGKMLYYDSFRHHIVLSIEGPSIDFKDGSGSYKIQPTVEELLLALQAQLRAKEFYITSMATQILSNRFMLSVNTYSLSPVISKILNNSQVAAVKKIFENNISFLWGPPGTGKTTTIAVIIHELIAREKKILAVSVSNMAVDQIALKCINAKKYPKPKIGELIRFGYARMQKVRNHDELFPERDNISRLRKEMKDLENEKTKTIVPAIIAKYQSDIAQKQLAIKKATIEPLKNAKAVLTTAVQVCLVEEFKDVTFDVVIIDEASMMSMAMVALLATIPMEKLIIAGDFRQLQPIAVAQTEMAYKWLHRDVFDLNGISRNYLHPNLCMLTDQHRMTEPICEIVSDTFYGSRLVTVIPEENKVGAIYPPNENVPIVFVPFKVSEGNQVSKTDNYSRYSIESSEKVVEILKKIIRKPGNIEIGIITPYAAQAQRIRRIITELSKSKDRNPKYGKVKTGTVHSFQGDEADIIIFDVVDNSIDGPGKLFKDKTGERLINVAFSRAKGKLIVIGDPDLFKKREESFEKIASVYNLLVRKYSV